MFPCERSDTYSLLKVKCLIDQDRLIEDEERAWTDDYVDKTAMAHFPGIDKDEALKGPILFSNWLSKDYMPVEQEQLRDYVKARLKVGFD